MTIFYYVRDFEEARITFDFFVSGKPTNNEVTASEENVVADGAMSDATVVFQKPAKYEEPYVEVVTYSKDGEVRV